MYGRQKRNLRTGFNKRSACDADDRGWNHLVDQGHRVEHPLGDDAVQSTTRSIKARLHRLRARAPFGNLEWAGVKLEDGGRRANLVLESPEGARVIFWIAERNGQPSGGYRLESGEASPTLVEGLAAMRGALRGAT